MPDDIKTGLPLQGGDYSAEPLYHIKGVDADTKRNARENFNDDLARKKKNEEQEEPPALPDPAEPPVNPLEDIRDGVVLSSQAQQILSGTPTPPPSTSESPKNPPPDEPPPPLRHIDILA